MCEDGQGPVLLPGAGAWPDFSWKLLWVGALLPADLVEEVNTSACPVSRGRSAARSRRSGGIDDLVRMVAAKMDWSGRPGGPIHGRRHRRAAGDRAATEGAPSGADRDVRGASTWRWLGRVGLAARAIASPFRAPCPWITESRAAALQPVEKITAPTLLLWGDADPISPVAVGRHLEQRISGARLHIVAGGDHDLAQTHATEIAPLIDAPSRLIRRSAGVPAR